MTHIQKYKENTRLIAGYVAFLDECKDYDSRLKLCGEIDRLAQQKARIEQMPYSQAMKDINDYTIEIPNHSLPPGVPITIGRGGDN